VHDPLGETLLQLGDEEELAVVDVDLSLVDRLRDRADGRTYPLLDDRRPDLYPAP
jgi:predicted amidohydrolase